MINAEKLRTIYVVVGENKMLNNISARGAYSTREAAERHVRDDWFDDRATIVELELDERACPDREVDKFSHPTLPENLGECRHPRMAPVNAPAEGAWRCPDCGAELEARP
jgi:hypothetical protein